MKKYLSFILCILTAFFGLGQTYTPVNTTYVEDFENALGTEWNIIQNGTGNDQARVVRRTTNGPYEGSTHLVMDNTNGGAGGYGTGQANLHLDLSSGTEYTLLFYFKDLDDEYDASEDGIFFRDSINSSFVKVFDIDGDDYTDNTWYQVILDVDELATANGLNLTDSFTIQFSHADDEDIPDDGFCFDSVVVYRTPAFISGSISGSDTICFPDIGTSNVTLTSLQDALYGEGNLTYTWESSTDLSTWSVEGVSIGPDTLFSAPTVSTFYRRCAATDSGQGPLCTAPVFYVVSPNVNLNIFGLDSTYCDNDAAATIYGSPVIGTFSGTGITDNGDGSATFDPTAGSTGNRTITYSYTDTYGCLYTKDSIVNVVASPNSSFTGLNATYLETDTVPDNLTPNTSGGVFTGYGVVGSTFVPAFAGITGSVAVTYTITQSGCTSSTTINTNIQSAGSGTIAGLGSTYCISDPPVTIYGTPNQGSFYDPGTPGYYAVLDESIDIGTSTTYCSWTCADTVRFVPSANGATNSVTRVVYYYSGAVSQQAVTIHPLPVLSVGGYSNPYCLSDAPFNLTGFNNSTVVSGTFTGPGISGTTFDPAIAGPGTHSITFSHTDANGCSNSTNISIVVNPLPTVSFSGLNTSYCKDGAVDQLIGNPLGTNAMFSVAGTNFTNDTLNFDPRSSSLVGGTSYSVIYTYQDPSTNCINSDTMYTMIDSLPDVSFNNLATKYCEDANIENLIGNGSGARDTSFFLGVGINNTGVNIADFDPTIVPLNGSSNVFDTISFVYVDGNQCRDTATQITRINQLPPVTISISDSTFCNDDQQITVNGYPTGGTFSSASGLGIISSQFFPANAKIGLDTLYYGYTETETGCTNLDSLNVIVLPAPRAGFTLSGYCNDDTIHFTDTSRVQSPGVIGTWNWSFGDGTSSTSQNTNHYYDNPGSYPISLTVITDSIFGQQCSNTFTIFDTIGAPPVADFEYDNVCFGETINFTNNSISTTIVDTIVSQTWDFGDGTITNVHSPNHLYSVDTVYFVSLTLMSQNNCTDTLVRRISIRPVVSSYPYFEDFEIDGGGWFAEGSTGGVVDSISWELNVANGTVINDSLNGNISWITSANDDHYNNEQSYVDGPCFDFTSLQKPMISMDIWSSLSEGADGAVLQYSLDNGNNWVTIGTIGDGINWYNRTSISGNPGNQTLNQVGWSYKGSGWTEVRHDLDMLAGQNQVRLRVAFGSDGSDSNDGFAFDNIWIGERNRLVLLEHFTNSYDPNSPSTDLIIDSLVERNKKDLVDIQYHVEFPGDDPMNNHNPADPAARALLYSILNTGRSVLNGNFYNDISAGVTDNHIKLQMLRDALFDLEVDQSIDAGVLTTRARMTALDSLRNMNISLHLAVVEKEITSIIGDNNDTEFRSVLKKMLPSSNGTIYTRDWEVLDEKGVEQKWTLENVFDETKIRVVAFVQDNETKEVYQVAISDTTVAPISLFEAEYLKENTLNMRLLPNPTSHQVVILYNQKVDSPSIEIYDQFGRQVGYYTYNGVQDYLKINLESYSSGVYIVKSVINNTVKTEKLIIEK